MVIKFEAQKANFKISWLKVYFNCLMIEPVFNDRMIYYTITNTLWLSIYTSMNTFIDLKLLALALQNILDTLSDVLVKCLRFSLIKM